MLWARFPWRREATPSWSSPLTACPRPWRRHRPTRSSSRVPRAPLPRDSATSAGRSPIRAGAAPPASPGSSPTSATCCAGSRARASATWSSPPSASRAITSRSSTISTSRRARSPTSSAFDSTALPPPMTIPSSSPCSPTSSGRDRREGRSRVKLAIVGGGIAGLAAAHRACELARERGLDLELSLFEASDRLGGTIQTERRDGFLVECGADSFLSEKPWALELCRRIGVEDKLVRTDDRFRRVFVVFRGRLHPLPEGFQLLAPTRFGPFLRSRLFSWPGKLRMALDLVLPRGLDPDESLGAFVRRRLGRQALERVAQPLVAGIYTADPDLLSLAATMPRCLELERRERSLLLALWRAARRAPAENRRLRLRRAAHGAAARHRLHLLEREVSGACARGRRTPAGLPGRGHERGRARGRRRDAGAAGAGRAGRAARGPGPAAPDARGSLSTRDAAVPDRTPGPRGGDRGMRARAVRPGPGGRGLSRGRHRRLRPLRRGCRDATAGDVYFESGLILSISRCTSRTESRYCRLKGLVT